MGLFQLDDTSPFQDYSGYNRVATISGTPATHASLVRGASYSQIFSSTTTAVFASPVFKQGYEDDAFALSAWVLPIGPVSEQQILGNPGQMDGLLINGTVVSMVTKYTTAPEARCSFDIQQRRAVFAFGVHTETKNSLYINGELVAEVELTEQQQADTFASTSANLSCGSTVGSQRIAVNAIAYYSSVPDGVDILRQYETGTELSDDEEVVSSFGGTHIPLSLNNADIFIDQWWETDEDWYAASMYNVIVQDESLMPQVEGNTSLPGYWLDSFILSAAEVTSIYGVSLNWDGEGATVEVSLDGTTWETAQRGVNVAMIPPGFDPTNKELQIRVSFPGGIVDDKSFLDGLNVVGLLSASNQPVGGRTVTYNNAFPERDYRPLAFHNNWGVEIGSGGSVTISADAVEAIPARTIEMWIRRSGTNPTVSISGTTYQNGVLSTATLDDGEWTLMHIVAAADVTGDIVISGPAQVGYVGIYESALSADEILDIYDAYVGRNNWRVNDNSVVAVSDNANNASIYAYDWSIQSAG